MNQNDNTKISIEIPKSDGFKFAVTSLTAFGTVLYVVYNYFRSIAVDPTFYGIVSLIIPIMIVSSITLIIYILVKGFSLEMEESERRASVEKWASGIYLITFWITIIDLLLILSLIFIAINPEYSYPITIIVGIFFVYLSIRNLLKYYLNYISILAEIPKNVWTAISDFFENGQKRLIIKRYISNKFIIIRQYISNKFIIMNGYIYVYRDRVYWFIVLLASSYMIYYAYSNYNKPDYNIFISAIEFITLFVILFGYIIYKKIQGVQDSKGWFFIISTVIIIVTILIWSASLPSFSSFAKGDVIIVMDSIYHKNSNPIPVSIIVTGPDTGLSIKLSQIFETNSSLIDDIELEAKNKPHKTKYLMGNSSGNGKYYVFINTFNLSEGYYELRSERPKYAQVDVKGFYLLDKNKNN